MFIKTFSQPEELWQLSDHSTADQRKEKSQLVASVPYDVVNREEAKQFADGNSLSYLHITRSEIDLPDITDVYSKQVYQKAKENLIRIIKEAPLKTDDRPGFYL